MGASPARSWRDSAGFAAVLAAGVWAAWNGAAFALDSRLQHRAESGWLIFAAVLVGLAVSRHRHVAPVSRADAVPAIAIVFTIAASLVVYARVLGNGLLSDDFVLLDRVQRGLIIDPGWNYVRPFPLAIWSLIVAVMPARFEPAALHALNACLHGINAWLVMRLAGLLGLSRAGSVVAGILFLAWPSHPEAVAWPCVIFDVATTACVLLASVTLFSERITARVRTVVIVVLTVVAVASKESGVTLPILLALLLPFVAVERRRQAVMCISASAVAVAVFIVIRVATDTVPLELYPAQIIKNKLLSRPFGALGFPLHRDVLQIAPWLGPAVAIGWVLLFVRAALVRDARLARLLMVSIGWVLVSALPLWTMFFVDETLSGSRFIYLASTMWAIATAALLGGAAAQFPQPAIPVAVLVAAGCVALAVAHQRPWLEAAAIRDRVLAAWAKVPPDCDPRLAENLPDNVSGAYIFRNGFAEAVAVPGRTYPVVCYTAWDGAAFRIKE